MWIATGAIIYPSQEKITTICISSNSSVELRSHNKQWSQAIPDGVNILRDTISAAAITINTHLQQKQMATASTEV